MADRDLEKAIDLLMDAEGLMNSLYVTIVEYDRRIAWTGRFGRMFDPLKTRIVNWQDKLWKSDFIKPSPSASPSQAPEEEDA